MSKLVVLKLEGDINQRGVKATLEIGVEAQRPTIELQGSLLPDPELAALLQQWQQDYRSLGEMTRLTAKGVVYGDTTARLAACHESTRRLRDRFLHWLASEPFQPLDRRLREELHRDETIRILIRTPNASLRRLPWSLWDVVERYANAELALSGPAYEQTQGVTVKKAKPVKILAILGHRAGIDVEVDHQLLSQLPHAKVTFLVEPERQQINDQLWDQAWDILFFAGHSQTEGESGRIYINPEASLTLEELKYGLRRAIAQGLQLAIFNSCDGLGLAQELEQLHLPQVIVMREPVPDRVAHTFLKYFLKAYAAGEPLYLAERQARERLQGLEGELPCASWLPVLCQNPAVLPPTWQTLRGQPQVETKRRRRFAWGAVLIASGLVTSGVVGVRSLGWLQSYELALFDQWMRWRPAEVSDRRILVVTVSEPDIRYQDEQKIDRKGSLSDQALQQVLQRLRPYQPSAIGLDIFHDFAFTPEVASMIKQQPLVALCQVAETPNSIAGPPGMKAEQLGFSDIPLDPGYTKLN
jgi:hypothetical protein